MVVQKSWYGNVFHTMVLGLFIIYQRSWISLNTSKYLEDLYLEEIPLKWAFQQDNHPKHTSKRASSWFQTKIIEVMEWLAQSPNLNPIQNLWGDIKNLVSEAKPPNSPQLWNVVHASWAEIPVSRCQKLVDSMQYRCAAVIKNNGYATKYSSVF